MEAPGNGLLTQVVSDEVWINMASFLNGSPRSKYFKVEMIYQMENDLPSCLRTLKVTFFIIPRRQMPQDVPRQARYRQTLFHESHLMKGWIRPRNCQKVVEEHEVLIV